MMERATVYRRALGPILWWAGTMAVLLAGLGAKLAPIGPVGFVIYWFAAGAVVVAGSLVLTRRQAIRDREPFWSAPMRRVAQALALPLLVAVALTVAVLPVGGAAPVAWVAIWALLYGCALHAAGFFAPHGLQMLGSGFVLWGLCVLGCPWLQGLSPHLLMGVAFGGLHLAGALYLTLTGPPAKDA